MQIHPIATHSTLPDMPSATNADHDGRYFREEEIIANYVPYTGANATVNLGAQRLTTTGDITGKDFTGKKLELRGTIPAGGVNAETVLDVIGAIGGGASAPTNGGDGAPIHLEAGAGAQNAGDGGTVDIISGAGAVAGSVGPGPAGTGGYSKRTAGTGGNGQANQDGGPGGNAELTAGDGGNAVAGNGDSGDGGDVEISAGAKGTTDTGNPGVDGKIHLNSDTIFIGSGIGLPYGAFHGDHIAFTQVDMVVDTWYNISDGDITDGPLNNISHNGGGVLTAFEAGVYFIVYTVAYEIDAANKHIEFGLSINGGDPANASVHTTSKFANQEQSNTGNMLLTLTAGQNIGVAVQTIDGGIPDIIVDNIHLTMIQIGG